MNKYEQYMVNCQQLVQSLDGILPGPELDIALHLIDHNEAPEGMCALAWSIVEFDVLVDQTIIDRIRKYASDMVDESDLPPDLDKHALKSE